MREPHPKAAPRIQRDEAEREAEDLENALSQAFGKPKAISVRPAYAPPVLADAVAAGLAPVTAHVADSGFCLCDAALPERVLGERL